MSKNSLPEMYQYRIRPGDSLSLIMAKMFNVGPKSARYEKVLDHLMALNPHIKNPHLIKAGDVLTLGLPPVNPLPHSQATSQKSIPHQVPPNTGYKMSPIVEPVEPVDQDNFWVLSWLEQNANYLTIPGSITFGSSGNLMSGGNAGLVTEISDLYASYKVGDITKGQYDYRRKLKLNQLKANLGSVEKLLFGNKTSHEAIRIAKSGGVPATVHIAKHADRINTIAKISRNGGYVLAGVGVAASCMQIANTQDVNEKNEIFVENLGSTSFGLVSGFLVGAFLVSNPVGWGTAIVLAVGATVASYGAGKVTGLAYDAYGNKVDLVNGLGVDRVCR